MPKKNALPPNLPPRGLSRDAAAQYIGVATGTFDIMVRDGKMPKPILLTKRRIVWDLHDIDSAFTRLKGEDTNKHVDNWDDL